MFASMHALTSVPRHNMKYYEFFMCVGRSGVLYFNYIFYQMK